MVYLAQVTGTELLLVNFWIRSDRFGVRCLGGIQSSWLCANFSSTQVRSYSNFSTKQVLRFGGVNFTTRRFVVSTDYSARSSPFAFVALIVPTFHSFCIADIRTGLQSGRLNHRFLRNRHGLDYWSGRFYSFCFRFPAKTASIALVRVFRIPESPIDCLVAGRRHAHLFGPLSLSLHAPGKPKIPAYVTCSAVSAIKLGHRTAPAIARDSSI